MIPKCPKCNNDLVPCDCVKIILPGDSKLWHWGFMNIEKIREKRAGMELEILKAVGFIVDKFRRETGFSPHSISISMTDVTDVTEIREKERHYIVSGCSVSVEL